jgi:hypothetical protein
MKSVVEVEKEFHSRFDMVLLNTYVCLISWGARRGSPSLP